METEIPNEAIRREELTEVLQNLSDLQETLNDYIGSNSTPMTERAESNTFEQAKAPVKDNFLLSFKGQLEHILNNNLLEDLESQIKLTRFLETIDHMISENKEYRDDPVDLEEIHLPDELKTILRQATKEGISPTELINKTVTDENDRKKLLELMVKYMMFQTEVVDGKPIPGYMSSRRVAHLVDVKDFIGQTVTLLLDELGNF
jgi:hypothetical protein